jgi:hypothetical protein
MDCEEDEEVIFLFAKFILNRSRGLSSGFLFCIKRLLLNEDKYQKL